MLQKFLFGSLFVYKMAAKRERCVNFSTAESHALCSLVKKYASVIENKKTDAVTWQKKEEAWERLAADFNASSSSLVPRSAKQLHTRYDKLKKRAKKMKTADKQCLYQTGGGPFKPPYFPDRELLEELLKLIPLSAEGRAPNCDSDDVFRRYPDSDEPASPRLDANYSDSFGEAARPATSATLTPREEEEEMDELLFETNVPVHEADSPTVTAATPGGKINWTKYQPGDLKSKKHPLLCSPYKVPAEKKTGSSRRRPDPCAKEQAAGSVNTSKFSAMADAKKELAKIQSSAIRNTEKDRGQAEMDRAQLHNIDVAIREAAEKDRAELHSLDLKIREEQLKEAQDRAKLHSIDLKIREEQLKEAQLNVNIKQAQLDKILHN